MNDNNVGGIGSSIGDTIHSGQSSGSKKKWEEIFWQEQKKYDSLSIIMESKKHSGKSHFEEAPAIKEGFSIELSSIVANNYPSNSRLDNGELTTPKDHNNAFINSQIKRGVTESVAMTLHDRVNQEKTILKEIRPLNPSSYQHMRRSLMHIDGDIASIWLGSAENENRKSLFADLREALDWFGLKLKRLVVKGTNINLPVQGLSQRIRGDENAS